MDKTVGTTAEVPPEAPVPPWEAADGHGGTGLQEFSEWTWGYEGYDPAEERLRESLCTLGNGYVATRGAAPETAADGRHYPGTYVAGCYNRLVSQVAGRKVENEDIVNLPNWLPLRFRARPEADVLAPSGIPDLADGAADVSPTDSFARRWLSPDDPSLSEYRQILDLRHGTLTRRLTFADRYGRRLYVEQQRLVHMGDPHLAALRTVFRAHGWSGEIDLEATLDGSVTNDGVARYRDLDGRHLTSTTTGTGPPDTVWLSCRTTTSEIRIALASRLSVTASITAKAPPRPEDTTVTQAVTARIAPGQSVIMDKTVALYTSRDPAVSDPLYAALDEVGRAGEFPALLATHTAAWARLWHSTCLDVPGDEGSILRLHLFQVLQTLSPHTAGLDVGVPARGLHGEAYRGHVFWDELFVLPTLNLQFPEVSRALLDYRYRRLPQARRAAADAGRRGAMYPWQSGSDGREETQTFHLNPRSGRWVSDHSRLQYHVGIAVAYNVWQYAQATGDMEFLHTRGAEMLLQIARFWADSAEFDQVLGRYRIRGVMGPDEYHDAYPDVVRPGLDDNAYTNVSAAWVLARALDLARTLPVPRRGELAERVGLTPAELERWEDVSRRLHVPFHRGVVSQFEGYGELAELDWEGYRARYGDIRRLDRILEAENDTVNRYQASKQADVLMLGYLFSPRELADLFERLGHRLDDDTWHRTVDYYLHRTSHGSTLSGLVHGWVLARVRRAEAWTYVKEALAGDVADLQGGTTAEGIHLGAMAGTVDLVQRGLTGLETREGALWLDPAPLPELSSYGFSLRFKGHWGIQLRMAPGQLGIALPEGDEPPIKVTLADRSVTLGPGESAWLQLPGR